MNMREAREIYGIEHYLYSESYKEAKTDFMKVYNNLVRAIDRLELYGKANRRTNPKRSSGSASDDTA
jgi:hypothetical protein